MSAMPLQHEEVYYPTSDGKPMAETPIHLAEMVYLITALQQRYRDVPDVYAIGNMMFYYVEGDARSVISPDVFLVKGIPKDVRRDTFQLWKEKTPCLVIEITSRSTRREDIHRKRDLYERMGVEEYFLHDPRGEYLRPALQGYRLVGGRYQPVTPAPDGSLISRTTGLRLLPGKESLRLIDLESGEPLPSFQEVQEAYQEVQEAYQEESAARRVAEERARVAEEELARLRRELESRGKS